MKINHNTILITGGGSGIGRALAEAFHALGNHVIVSGRRQSALDAVTAANPGMASLPLDITDAASIRAFAERVVRDHPALNVVIHNAGIMRNEDVTAAPAFLEDAEATVVTNLLGPIRLSAALLPHLQRQPASTILTVSSGLAFVPLAATPTYCATKAAIHAYSIALRLQLQATSVEVIEIVPPYVRTGLQGEHQASDPRAMPLDAFIGEVMSLLGQPGPEIVVERCKPLRFAAESGRMAEMVALLNATEH
ncbi:SDR family oxidoreductase [Methylobacterium planeticum]|uniref:SDR family NAD(P)-dependent oxidoreductase n=1 Tax=Methylobacterium planeticum TaxID=2615211 RepID=A0A6N6MLW7_9HYPH|nr:SDR family oxidoreductase [Methylobacterium planeticum]KAB1072286.1 SDR family NAD(P)-dependent oxidoreductase [Methylobacterium planeticum]